jgi:DNA repair protein SbcD/Mre11
LTVKFIHAADIHLDSALRGLERYEGAPVDEIRGATRRAFDNLISLAIDEGVDFVLLAGDLYDGDWKDYNTGLYFVDRMRRLRDAGIRVFMVRGNHDAASQITRHLRLPENVKMLANSEPERIFLDDLNVAISGQSFASRAVTQDLSQSYPQGDPHLFNIGILHTCLSGRPGHESYAPCTVEGLCSKGYQYWALGHVHQSEVVSRQPWIVFPGNLQGRHIRETGPKGCALVTVEDGEISSLVQRDLDVLRWSLSVIELNGGETVDDVYERVHYNLRQSLDRAGDRPVAARIVIQSASAVHSRLHSELERWTQEYRALATDLGGAGIWLEKVLLNTRPSMSLDRVLAQEDALGGLLRGISGLELDAAALSELAGELSPLRQKLPPEILSGEDCYDPNDPEELRQALEDVKELLVTRLLKPGAE